MGAWLSGCGAAAPRTIEATHVPTWAYDDGTPAGACDGGGEASAALVDRWVTFAESNCGPESLTTKALTDCIHGGVTHCTPVAYLEANWNYEANDSPHLGPCDPIIPRAEPEAWWLHVPGTTAPAPANRLATTAAGGGNLVNQTSAAVRGWYEGYVRSCLRDYPALMMDDTGGSLSSLLLRSAGSLETSTEIPGDQALVAAHQEMAAAITRPGGSAYVQIDNGLSANNHVGSPFALLDRPRGVQGLIVEGAPMSDGLITPNAAAVPVPDPVYYRTLLDELAYVDARPAADFIVLLSYDPSGAKSARLVQQATEMLGYDGDHVVDWADLETRDAGAANLAVWPEEGIVPTDPVQSMKPPGGDGCLAGDGAVCTRGGHLDLELRGTPGVYVREFRHCYDRGALFGACAAIVNDTGSSFTVSPDWLTQRYQWQIGLSGGDVQSGGTVQLEGRAFRSGSTTIGPWTAMLLSGAGPAG